MTKVQNLNLKICIRSFWIILLVHILASFKLRSTKSSLHTYLPFGQKFKIQNWWNNVMNNSLMPCPFTSLEMFCADPTFLSQPKNLTAFSASSKNFVLAQKTILLNANHLYVWHKMFVTATICKWFFCLAQNILGPVKGQGIRWTFKF